MNLSSTNLRKNSAQLKTIELPAEELNPNDPKLSKGGAGRKTKKE